MLDQLIVEFDRGLRTLFASARSMRLHPDAKIADNELNPEEKRHAIGLMRVNHCGEVCAQALYQGQAITTRTAQTQIALRQAAQEEIDHLAWTEQRIRGLGGQTSWFNPVWYLGSLSMGIAAGWLGDKWNLGFLEETERQVEAHLNSHLQKLPQQDAKSRAIVEQMRTDELQHAQTAQALGAAQLPWVVRQAMTGCAKIMAVISYRI